MDTRLLYRVLRPDQDQACLIAKNPFAGYSVVDHVSNGSLKTQYISTCNSLAAVMHFAEKGNTYAVKNYMTGKREIVSINLTLLQHLVPNCQIFDLTLLDLLNTYILDIPPPFPGSDVHSKARKCAAKFQEVLINLPVINTEGGFFVKPIPKECVAVEGCV